MGHAPAVVARPAYRAPAVVAHAAPAVVAHAAPAYHAPAVVARPAYHAPAVVAHAAPVVHHAPAVVAHAAPAYHAPAVVHAAPAVVARPASAYHAPAAAVYDESPAPYTYTYGVADDYSQANFNAGETADGAGNVQGSYSVSLPDGRRQNVAYTSNGYDGYVAEVSYEGTPVYPEIQPYTPPKAAYAPAPYQG